MRLFNSRRPRLIVENLIDLELHRDFVRELGKTLPDFPREMLAARKDEPGVFQARPQNVRIEVDENTGRGWQWYETVEANG